MSKLRGSLDSLLLDIMDSIAVHIWEREIASQSSAFITLPLFLKPLRKKLGDTARTLCSLSNSKKRNYLQK